MRLKLATDCLRCRPRVAFLTSNTVMPSGPAPATSATSRSTCATRGRVSGFGPAAEAGRWRPSSDVTVASFTPASSSHLRAVFGAPPAGAGA